MGRRRATATFLYYVIILLLGSLVRVPYHEAFFDPIPNFLRSHVNPILPVKTTTHHVSILKDFEVTWYNDQGLTASGGQTTAGRTVGVDPKIIPLGTWIEIHMPDGSILKRRAEDTGGAVKGHVLDVYASRSDIELLKRGRTKGAQVLILGGV